MEKHFLQLLFSNNKFLCTIQSDVLYICSTKLTQSDYTLAKSHKSNNATLLAHQQYILCKLYYVITNSTSNPQINVNIDLMKNVHLKVDSLSCSSNPITLKSAYGGLEVEFNNKPSRHNCAYILLDFNVIVIPLNWTDGVTKEYSGIPSIMYEGFKKYILKTSFCVKYITINEDTNTLKNIALHKLIKLNYNINNKFIILPIKFN